MYISTISSNSFENPESTKSRHVYFPISTGELNCQCALMKVNEGFLEVKVATISSYIIRPAAQSSQISKMLHEFWSTDLFDLVELTEGR